MSLLPDTETWYQLRKIYNWKWKQEKGKKSNGTTYHVYVKGQLIRKKRKNRKKKRVKTGEKKENNKQAKDQNITHSKEKKKQQNKLLM